MSHIVADVHRNGNTLCNAVSAFSRAYLRNCTRNIYHFSRVTRGPGWLGSRVVSVPDPGASGVAIILAPPGKHSLRANSLDT